MTNEEKAREIVCGGCSHCDGSPIYAGESCDLGVVTQKDGFKYTCYWFADCVNMAQWKDEQHKKEIAELKRVIEILKDERE